MREFPDQDADVLVVDPPRAGLAPEAIDLIASTSARDVAYVSCDPATLARDLKRFVEEGTFSPVKITPVDLFPQTFHCETVVHLKRKLADIISGAGIRQSFDARWFSPVSCHAFRNRRDWKAAQATKQWPS